MTKKQKILLAAGVVVLLACVGVLLGILLPSCGASEDNPIQADPDGNVTYTVQVKNASEKPLAGVGVYIYEDATMAELIWYDTTNENGEMVFTNAPADTYVAVLADVPGGYVVEDHYPITGERTEIVLSAGVLSEEDLQTVTYSLGDMMMDFTITDTDGNTHTLSELLKTKKAVVLNFWYIECQPCNREFPYMQEAYEAYADDIEILALNPVNQDEEAVAAFREQLGLTFPMAVVDAAWEQMMQLAAYPTTVVIDRYGNISLVHEGMIEETAVFEQMFAYFAADDYAPTAIESISQIATPSEGSSDNPMMTGGDTNFKITVQPGQTYYLELYKMTAKTYVTVSGEDFYLTYNGKEYDPSKGSVTVTVQADGPSAAVLLAITNTGTQEQTYTVQLSQPKGTYANPYTLKTGEFSAKSAAGNDQGVYYIYTAKEEGYLSVQCLSVSPSNVEYGLTLYNLSNYVYRTLSDDGQINEEGEPVLTMPVKKGQKIQFIVAAMPDDEWNYPAATFQLKASFTAGEVQEQEQVELPSTIYSVTVTDPEGSPMQGVSVNLKGTLTYTPETDSGETEGADADAADQTVVEEIDLLIVTDAEGVASIERLPGTLTATVQIPEGYQTAQTEYILTAETPAVTVVMEQIVIVMEDYTVQVVDPDGQPVSGVAVMVGSSFDTTDENGAVEFRLPQDSYTAYISQIPSEYYLEKTVISFPEGQTRLTVDLEYILGTAKNPIVVEGVSAITTDILSAGGQVYYTVTDLAGATALTIADGDAYVIINGGEPVYAEDGVVTVDLSQVEYPASVVIGNNGAAAESYRISIHYPEGTVNNPKELTSYTRMQAVLTQDHADGYYFSGMLSYDMDLTVTYRAPTPTLINHTVTISCNGSAATLTYENGAATTEEAVIHISAYEPVTIRVVPTGETKTGTVTLRGSLEEEDLAEGTARYSVMLVDEFGNPAANVPVQFVQDGAVAAAGTTNSYGVWSAVLDLGSYGLEITDELYTYDESLAVVSDTATALTLEVVRLVPEGKTRYSVAVMDFADVAQTGVMVRFMKDGALVYAATTNESGNVTVEMDTAKYTVSLAFSGDAVWYYDDTSAILTELEPGLVIRLTDALPGEENTFYTSENTFVTKAVTVGGTYVTLQPNMLTYFAFQPTEAGTYEITIGGENAKVYHYGGSTWPSLQTEATTVENGYILSVGESYVGTSGTGVIYVIGATGSSDAILSIVRICDAVFNENEVEPTPYEMKATPTPFTISAEEGERLVDVDLFGATEDYQVVLGSDGYYHLGTADGPVIYLTLGLQARYVSLYQMCGGTGIGGTALRYRYYDEDGVFYKIDYTDAVLAYAECMDETYGIYPMNEDLYEMLQKGGGQMGWWDPDHPNYLFNDEDGNPLGVNDEIAWLFACCYVPDAAAAQVMTLSLEETASVEETAPVEETASVEETAPVEETTPTEETVPAEASQPDLLL